MLDLSHSPEARRARRALADHRAKAHLLLTMVSDLLGAYVTELQMADHFLDRPLLMRNAEVRREAILRELQRLNP